jgi:hypothetical protein
MKWFPLGPSLAVFADERTPRSVKARAEVVEVPSWLSTPLIEAVNVEVAEVVAVVVFDMPSLYASLSRYQANIII